MSAMPIPPTELGRLSPEERDIAARMKRAEANAKPVREPDRFAEIHVNVGGRQSSLEVECFGRWTQAFPESREQPGEAGGFIVDRVEYQGMDITDLFTKDQLDELASA
jgi:hypothetical protein